MKTSSVKFRNALQGAMQMSTRVFKVLLLLTICQIASIQAQTVPSTGFIRQFSTTGLFADFSQDIVAGDYIYMGGYSSGGTFPGQTLYGSSDAFVIKYDPSGTFLWVHQFGTNQAETGAGIASDGSGVYITGNTGGIFPGQVPGGSTDVYIRKINSSGNEIWTRQLGTTGIDRIADGIAADVSAVYIAGTTLGSFPGYTNPNPSPAKRDVFLAKYNAGGDRLWIKQIEYPGDDYCMGMYLDASGLYICGYRENNDIYISKFTLEGINVWTQSLGTSGTDVANEISGDETGIYISGNTNGTFPGQSYAGGTSDVFAAKYDFQGNQLWLSEFGTNMNDIGAAIAVNTSGVYIFGNTNGSFPGQTNSGGNDLFTAKYDKAGNQLWVTMNGSAQVLPYTPHDYAGNVALSSSKAFLTGYTAGLFPGQSNYGGADGYLIDLTVNLPPVADCGDGQLKIVTETVQLDGSGSSDQDGDAITYAWSLVSRPAGSTATLSSSTTVNPTFDADAAGDYLIQLIANDGTVDSDPCLVIITVQTPQEATQDLIGDVEELVAAGVLNQGQGNALTAKLQAAIQKMNQGNYNAAINILNAFINQVHAFYNSGILTEEQANALIASAERIIDCLGRLMLKDGGMISGGDLSYPENLQTWNNPNPFNSSTTINYSLPADLAVTLTVYDSRGKKVSLLVNELQSTGKHAVTFRADGLSSGIYYYRIQAGNASVTKKLILVR